MDLVLWRHAEAEPGEPDLGRRLTAKGLKQADRIGDWLDRFLPDTACILGLPADRAQQTALALKRKFGTVDEIGHGAQDSRESVVVVGHQPTLGAVASFLLSGEEAWWSVKKGAVWWLSNRDKSGASSVVLRVVIGPDFV